MNRINRIIHQKLKPINKINEDDFLRRLKISVIGEGMLNDGNIFMMDYALRNMPKDGIVLEIGSYGGLSTNTILHLLEKYGLKEQVFGCDAWIYEGFMDSNQQNIDSHIDGKLSVSRKNYMAYIKSAFIDATLLLHPNNLPYICHKKSDAFFLDWNQEKEHIDVFQRNFQITKPISFAYIDGDHSFHQTKKDFCNVVERLSDGGFILIDDSADYLNFGSSRFAREIAKNKEFKVVFKNPNYLFKKL